MLRMNRKAAGKGSASRDAAASTVEQKSQMARAIRRSEQVGSICERLVMLMKLQIRGMVRLRRK
jgi:hypothetical protein